MLFAEFILTQLLFYWKVARHLTKLFDSMAKLKFELDGDQKPIKNALGMFSKDGEYVDLSSPCDLSGQVETWLNQLLDSMKATVRHEMTEAVSGYEEKPRDQWLFDFPAQVGTYVFPNHTLILVLIFIATHCVLLF